MTTITDRERIRAIIDGARQMDPWENETQGSRGGSWTAVQSGVDADGRPFTAHYTVGADEEPEDDDAWYLEHIDSIEYREEEE